MIRIEEYVDRAGRSRFGRWLERVEPTAAAKVVTALYRLEQGNTSQLKSVGSGVLELRIDFGPGYRVYLGRIGDELVILLGGGAKKEQARDIAAARAAWRDFRSRRRDAADS